MNNHRSFYAVARSASETLSSTIFEDRFPPCFDSCESILLPFTWSQLPKAGFLMTWLTWFNCISGNKETGISRPPRPPPTPPDPPPPQGRFSHDVVDVVQLHFREQGNTYLPPTPPPSDHARPPHI